MNLDSLRDEKTGKLPAYAWPGGYPLMYLDGHNSVLCPDCANEATDDDDPRFRPAACFVHWEGPPEYCEGCNGLTESAYGDPDEKEED